MFLYDGFRALMTFPSFPAAPQFRIKEITWPELEVGEINTDTMHNRTLRTKAPKGLISIGTIKMVAQWEPGIYGTFLTAAYNASGMRAVGSGRNNVGFFGVNTPVLLTAPDASTLTLYAFVNKFTPGSFKEGEFPTADMEVTPTNTNPSATVTGQSAHDVLPTFTAGFLINQVVA